MGVDEENGKVGVGFYSPGRWWRQCAGGAALARGGNMGYGAKLAMCSGEFAAGMPGEGASH